jgi:hypothetical protein
VTVASPTADTDAADVAVDQVFLAGESVHVRDGAVPLGRA